ncbi:ubiquitin-related modifier 1-like protein [Lentinula edodes]|uniref:Ubiquitin-related modifier 1 n=1 Tax=Lentinula edodes TaxID=5353 RepID=A0A1Q3EFC7_LENED|nr:ubiquitin-related modifier 1-like protein [Lentinula edodes]
MVPFDNNTKVLPDALSGVETKPADIEYLLYHLRDHLLQERPELFMEYKTVRPGILVLVNNTDWELEGEGEYNENNGLITKTGVQNHPMERDVQLLCCISTSTYTIYHDLLFAVLEKINALIPMNLIHLSKSCIMIRIDVSSH